MYEGYEFPCVGCERECDVWEMQACCTLCRWKTGTDDSDVLGCADCTAQEDI
jgi:hypothetical protein